MRVSQYYKLGRDQPSLEFVDVDIKSDVPVFIDPRALHSIESPWSKECISLLQNFFDTVMSAIQSGDDQRAKDLLASLGEPNETHLGLSAGRAQGRGMGRQLATDAWTSLSKSRAVTTGLLEDLEDTVLFVEGIGFDIISDIATNIIRQQLIEFTQEVCDYYSIPMLPDITSGQMWNRKTRRWYQNYTSLPVIDHHRLLLVPKAIVRRNQSFNPSEYYNQYVLPQLQQDELNAGSSLVQVLKKGGRRVTKKAVKDKYGGGKRVNLSTTIAHPDLLDKYRQAKSVRRQPPGHDEIAALTESLPPDWDALLAAVKSVAPGKGGATAYHHAVESLLTALFYPALDMPQREFPVHKGRKRIDITYVNLATRGFFDWVNRVQNAPAPNVFVECKNYKTPLGNPELDQLAGRFSPLRGRLGLLCHRGFGDKDKVIERCRDTALDDRGFIIALDDDDLETMVNARKADPTSVSFKFLQERFNELV